MSLSLSGCSSHRASAAEPAQALQVLSTSPARLLDNPHSAGKQFPAACQAWQLSPQQVARFFALATAYPPSARHSFDYLPCEIAGELVADGQRWQYRINAASTASWTHAGQERFFGCSLSECEALVLMLPDNGEP